MLYPNLTAEYQATHIHISSMCSYANVTQDLMQDVLFGNESLCPNEMRRLHSLLFFSSHRNKRSYDYLFAPVLGIFRPHTKNRHKVIELREKIKEAERSLAYLVQLQSDKIAGSFNRIHRFEIQEATDVLVLLEQRKPVRYANYRYALSKTEFLIKYAENKRRPPRDRGTYQGQ